MCLWILCNNCNILWAFGIPQCVFVKNLCSLGPISFEGLRITQWRSKHVALSIYYFKVYEINCCVIDWHICLFCICQNTSGWQTLYICIYIRTLWYSWFLCQYECKFGRKFLFFINCTIRNFPVAFSVS